MLQHINPCVKCMPGLGEQAGYAISLADGFIYLQKKKVLMKNINAKSAIILSKTALENCIPVNNS